jgi:hypothetical protein
MQENGLGFCGTVEFIDEYRLLTTTELKLSAPPSLVVTDTGKIVRGAPVQTLFHFPLPFICTGRLSLLLERGVHKPSPTESLAPFHQDPAQRIIALAVPYTFYYLVFQVGALLELLELREGSEIGWDEWKSRVVTPSTDQEFVRIWVSGCRLFCVGSIGEGQNAQMEVYDFSVMGRAKHLSGRVNELLGGVRYLSSTGARARVLCNELLIVRSGHESTVLSYVSVRTFFSL